MIETITYGQQLYAAASYRCSRCRRVLMKLAYPRIRISFISDEWWARAASARLQQQLFFLFQIGANSEVFLTGVC